MKLKHRGYRLFLWMFLGASLIALVAAWLTLAYSRIPGTIKLKAGEEQMVDFHVPISGEIRKEAIEASVTGERSVIAKNAEESIPVKLGQKVIFKASGIDNYTMDVKLFGVVPFKSVDVEVIQDKQVIPVGMPIGIYVKTDGILVIATGEFTGNDGEKKDPCEYVLKQGDYILAMNGQQVDKKADFMDRVAASEGEELILTVKREEETFEVAVTPEKNQYGEYKLGVWVRDNAQGVGTLTYVDEDDHFGALGHGINDMDTAQLMDLKGGTLYKTDIIAIKKGRRGVPGELTGIIEYREENKLGEISENTLEGIFGTLKVSIPEDELAPAMHIALKQDVQIGPAQILCALDGEQKLYDIEIMAVHLDNSNINRGIELKITDQELLDTTGGIVQGMSGSPIIQNGKLIGAVTHVFVQDATKGYGIFIENMLQR